MMEEVVGASVVAGGFLDDVVVGSSVWGFVDDVVGSSVFGDDVVGSSVTGLSVTGVSLSQAAQKVPGLTLDSIAPSHSATR